MRYCGYCGRPLADGEVCHCRDKIRPKGSQDTNAGQDVGNESLGNDFDTSQRYSGNLGDPGQDPTSNSGSPFGEEKDPGNGSPFDEGLTLRERWVNLKNRVGLGEPETNDVDYYERGLKIVPQCIEPDEGEVPIKQYNAAVLRTRLQFARSEGRLQVTNKRVIFRATGRSFAGRQTLQQEFAIDEISGISITKNHRFSLMNFLGTLFLFLAFSEIVTLVLYGQNDYNYNRSPGSIVFMGTILGIISFVPFFILYKKFWLKFMALSFGFGNLLMAFLETSFSSNYRPFSGISFILLLFNVVLLFINGLIIWMLPNLIISVETKTGSSAVYIRRDEHGAFGKKENYTGFAEVMPWVDTEVMIIELWAMISDIKKFGDAAIEMWKQEKE